MSALVPINDPVVERLIGFGSVIYRHDKLNVIYTDHERHSLEEANAAFGIRDWRHMSVSLVGWVKDGPLPSWAELSHLVYGDHPEFHWDRSRDVLQFLPPPVDYVNVAEALHLWQPR